jgi:hypothetical protein
VVKPCSAPGRHGCCNAIGGEFRLLSCSLNRLLACLLSFGSALAFGPYLLEFIIGEMLDTDEGILGGADTDPVRQA